MCNLLPVNIHFKQKYWTRDLYANFCLFLFSILKHFFSVFPLLHVVLSIRPSTGIQIFGWGHFNVSWFCFSSKVSKTICIGCFSKGGTFKVEAKATKIYVYSFWFLIIHLQKITLFFIKVLVKGRKL